MSSTSVCRGLCSSLELILRSHQILFPILLQKRNAGHSKWSNRKFKKMHIDNARAKVFGKLSMEIIQSVKENGGDPKFNSKLQQLITKAKSSCMPRDRIESSIKSALRNTDELRTRLLLQSRGVGKCGLLIDALTPNATRTRHEIRGILRKQKVTFIEDGSVSFMFDRKGVVTIKDKLTEGCICEEERRDMVEETAIVIGAESVEFGLSDEELSLIHFICEPLEVSNAEKELLSHQPKVELVCAEVQYIAKNCLTMTEELIEQNHVLIELLSDHPDVLCVYDNITNYPSSTIKLDNVYAPT